MTIIRMIPNLPANASEQAFRARLRAMGLKEKSKIILGAKGKPKSVPVDPDWDHDIKQLKARTAPHTISENGTPRIVSVKLNTLVVDVDEETNEIVAWIYKED